MKKFRSGLLVLFVALFFWGLAPLNSQEKAVPRTVQTYMVITDEALRDDSELAILRPENIQVKQGKDLLKVEKLIPARGDNATLQLFIMIDDTTDTGIGNNLNELKDFINAQPATTVIGVAYIVQRVDSNCPELHCRSRARCQGCAPPTRDTLVNG